MTASRSEFKARIRKLPRKQVDQTRDPVLTTRSLSSALYPFTFLLTGFFGFVNYLIVPRVIRSFAVHGSDVEFDEELFEAMWVIPSLGIAMAFSIICMACAGLSTGGHFRSAMVGVGLAFLLTRALTGG